MIYLTNKTITTMGKSLKGTRTEKNLMTSFAGESQARMRYTYFASAAKKEGYEQIAAIFLETAEQEKEQNPQRDQGFPDYDKTIPCSAGSVQLRDKDRQIAERIHDEKKQNQCGNETVHKHPLFSLP